ncbi:MAG TPA: ATP-binding cassette domain-containing protein [Chloroflexi bacterium]|nr:ATP-binding cassette domain-containing protein [Chloroflexota bacterium]
MNRQDANNSLLEVRDLAKYFAQGKGFFGLRTRPVQAVDGVSLSVKRQESLGLVGESGCGKTTLGRCILRLIEPTSGQVLFEGVNILTLGPTEMRRLWRNMQMIFQNPFSSLNPRLNVLKLVSEPLRTHTDLRGDALSSRVVELLGRVGLSREHLSRYPHEFSGGQLQRIAVARALALNPKLLILDEPTSALDVSVQAQILNLLQELQREFNLTYLFISHNLSVVQHVSDRIAVMYLGKVVELSTSETIFGGALHPYTEALLSSTPIPDPDVKKKRIVLEGGVPSSINPPPGCRFHPRCPKVMPLCSQVEPELIDMGNGHLVACHIYARPT